MSKFHWVSTHDSIGRAAMGKGENMDRNKYYEIFPLIGVSEVRFGMTFDEVNLLWGVPARVSRNYAGERTEVRDGCVVTYDSVGSKVLEIGFPCGYKGLALGGVVLFQDEYKKTILDVEKLSRSRYEGDGFIVFPDIGVSFSGFAGDDGSLLTVTAFENGRWDDELNDMVKVV